MKDLKEGIKNFSISKYINDHIYMFGGNSIDAIFELDNERGILIVKDWFGENSKISYKNEKILAHVKCNETALYYWTLQYADVVKAISPISFVDKIKEGLKEAFKRYE